MATLVAGCTPQAQNPLGGPDAEVPEAFNWDTPLSVDSLGAAVSPEIEGASLQEIISGQVDARGEGRSCTACHFDGTITLYRPEVDHTPTLR